MDSALGLCDISLSNSLQNITKTVVIEIKIENKRFAFSDAKRINLEILRCCFGNHLTVMD